MRIPAHLRLIGYTEVFLGGEECEEVFFGCEGAGCEFGWCARRRGRSAGEEVACVDWAVLV